MYEWQKNEADKCPYRGQQEDNQMKEFGDGPYYDEERDNENIVPTGHCEGC